MPHAFLDELRAGLREEDVVARLRAYRGAVRWWRADKLGPSVTSLVPAETETHHHAQGNAKVGTGVDGYEAGCGLQEAFLVEEGN